MSVAQLLQNPLSAVRAYWCRLLTDHADAVPAALQPLVDLISDAAHAGATVTGDGSPEAPWVMPLTEPVEVQMYRDGTDPASSVHVAVAARYTVDTLGQGCTRVDTSLRVALATLDLVAGRTAFCSLVEGRLTTAASGEDFARFRVGDADLRADHIGLSGSWRPGHGLAVDVLTPNLAVAFGSDETGVVTVPLVVPAIGADGSVTLPPEGWDSVERLAALLTGKSGAPWLAHLLEAFGWRFDGAITAHHLRLADLVADPATTVQTWLLEVAPHLPHGVARQCRTDPVSGHQHDARRRLPRRHTELLEVSLPTRVLHRRRRPTRRRIRAMPIPDDIDRREPVTRRHQPCQPHRHRLPPPRAGIQHRHPRPMGRSCR